MILVPIGIWLVLKLVSEDVMEDCRKRAAESDSDGKPKNSIAAGVIVAIWMILAGVAIYVVAQQLGYSA